MALEPQIKPSCPGGDVAVLDAGHRVHGAQVRVCLTGQVGLDEGKGNHDHQRDQQGHGELVLEKGTEGAAPSSCSWSRRLASACSSLEPGRG